MSSLKVKALKNKKYFLINIIAFNLNNLRYKQSAALSATTQHVILCGKSKKCAIRNTVFLLSRICEKNYQNWCGRTHYMTLYHRECQLITANISLKNSLDKQTNKQTNKQTDKQTNIQTFFFSRNSKNSYIIQSFKQVVIFFGF